MNTSPSVPGATGHRLQMDAFSHMKAVIVQFPLSPHSCTAYLLDPNLAEYLMLTVTYLMSDELPATVYMGVQFVRFVS